MSFLQMERGERWCRARSTGWCLRTVLLMLQGVINRGKCPIPGTECRVVFPVSAGLCSQ